jgi:hypothetical protein
MSSLIGQWGNKRVTLNWRICSGRACNKKRFSLCYYSAIWLRTRECFCERYSSAWSENVLLRALTCVEAAVRNADKCVALWTLVVTIYTNCFIINKKLCILSTMCICVFRIILVTNSDYFTKKRYPVGCLCGEVMCFLWNVKSSFTITQTFQYKENNFLMRYLFQKDERALPGNLETRKYNSLTPKCSVSHYLTLAKLFVCAYLSL